jgi:hypothetical protein
MTQINRLLTSSLITNAELEKNAAATERPVQRRGGQSWRKLFAEALVVLAVPYLAAAPQLWAYAVNVPRRPLPIHGPFDVSSGELVVARTPLADSAFPIPPLPERKTHLLHFEIKGTFVQHEEGHKEGEPVEHPTDESTGLSKQYTPDSGWIIDKSLGNGGYSIVKNIDLGVIQGPKVEIYGNTLEVRGETKSWGHLDASITIYLKYTNTTYTDSTRSPRATDGFIDVARLGGIDPGIAVGNDYILVCDDATGVAVYDKAGKLLDPKPGGSAFANPFRISSLFAKVKASIDPQLNYPPDLPPGYKVADGHGIEAYGDCRVVFDPYRKRFWIYAEAKNLPPYPKFPYMYNGTSYGSLDDMVTYKGIRLCRRNKAAVAVSKTEDPRDGFYTYWWNESIHNGECNNPQGCNDPDFKVAGDGADYPSIGISPKYFLATNGVSWRDPDFYKGNDWNKTNAQAWLDCKTSDPMGPFKGGCGPNYVHIVIVDADSLATGLSPTPNTFIFNPQGTSFGLFVDAKNYIIDRNDDGEYALTAFRGVRPVIIHGAAGTMMKDPMTGKPAGAYFVNNFINRSDLDPKTGEPKCYLVLWSLVENNLNPTLYPIDNFEYHNWGQVVLNACYRDGNLYATFGHSWCPSPNEACSPSIRVIRVNTLNGEVKEHSFGRNNVDDDPSALFAYQWPGIQVNKNGDIVVVYTRHTNGTFQLQQEVRFTVWYHNEPDQRPSRVLKLGEALYYIPDKKKGAEEVFAKGTDTAGIAVDPSDNEAVWIAHIFAAADQDGYATRRIAFGKIFGGP